MIIFSLAVLSTVCFSSKINKEPSKKCFWISRVRLRLGPVMFLWLSVLVWDWDRKLDRFSTLFVWQEHVKRCWSRNTSWDVFFEEAGRQCLLKRKESAVEKQNNIYSAKYEIRSTQPYWKYVLVVTFLQHWYYDITVYKSKTWQLQHCMSYRANLCWKTHSYEAVYVTLMFKSISFQISLHVKIVLKS